MSEKQYVHDVIQKITDVDDSLPGIIPAVRIFERCSNCRAICKDRDEGHPYIPSDLAYYQDGGPLIGSRRHKTRDQCHGDCEHEGARMPVKGKRFVWVPTRNQANADNDWQEPKGNTSWIGTCDEVGAPTLRYGHMEPKQCDGMASAQPRAAAEPKSRT